MKVELQNLKQIAHQQVDGDEELEWMEGGVEGARKWAIQVLWYRCRQRRSFVRAVGTKGRFIGE
jgi:hypothetical protein